MCQILYSEKSNEKDLLELFDRGLRYNSDSFGITTVDDDKQLFCFKTIVENDARDFILDNSSRRMLIHMRDATGGSNVNIENCHPFYIAENLYFAHEGILNIPSVNGKSDSAIFAEKLTKIKNIDEIFDNLLVQAKVKEMAGGGQVLVFFSNYKFINLTTNKVENASGRYHNIWYSNRYHI